MTFTQLRCRHLIAAMGTVMLIATWNNHCSAQMIVAHRGASYAAPENTLIAFQTAWEQGADAIEADFYLTADGQIACIHDKTTKRVAPGQPELTVAQATLKQLRQLDVGRWKAEQFAGQRIPTLKEVLAIVPEGKRIFVELKSDVAIVALLQKQLAACGLDNQQIVIIAFDEAVVQACRQVMPQYKCNWLTGYKRQQRDGVWKPTRQEVIASLRTSGAVGLGTQDNEEVVDSSFVKSVRDAGFEFHVWTVNDIDAAKRYVQLGVDSITTDRPALIRQALPAAD